MSKKVIAIDLGGTKISTAVITSDGRILESLKEPTVLEQGWPGLKRQLIRICRDLMKRHKTISAVGVGSAGPLHSEQGVLLDPTNFGWTSKKKIFFRKEISSALKIPVVFDNDAIAAILGEKWKGKAANNSVVITLGTGVGVGVLVDGKVVRGGDGYHPEVGHLILRPEDPDAHCECGAKGCAEAYLSGVNFTNWVEKKRHGKVATAKELTALARNGNQEIRGYFNEYAKLMTQFICSLIVLYYPQEIILAGSFAEASDLFLDQVQRQVATAMQRREKTQKVIPKITVSKLKNMDGVWGAAKMAFHHKDYYKNI